jgi:hypothetical protein
MDTQAETTFFGNPQTVKFPNIGQYIDIERLKTTLSDGRYPLMAMSPLNSTRVALHLIDAVAYGSVLMGDVFYKKTDVPDLKSILDLSMTDEKVIEMLRWYQEDYVPFHNGIEKRMDRPAEIAIEEPVSLHELGVKEKPKSKTKKRVTRVKEDGAK